MKKIELSEEERNRVIKLRQSGLSWLRIKKETDIPRHVAKRSYEEWERTRLADELKAVRREVAMEDFREHRRLLMELARDLTGLLDTTLLPLPVVDADNYLNNLFKVNRWAEKTGEAPTDKQVERWNRMLFKALQDHTLDRIRWEALDKWKAGWNDCREAVQVLGNEIRLSLETSLGREPELKEKFDKAGGSEYVDKVSGVVLKLLWLALRAGRTGVAFRLSDIEQGSTVFIRTEDGSPDVEIPWNGRESAPMLVGALDTIAVGLYSGDGVRRIADCLDRMKSSYEELGKTLDALVLGPIILGTRCRLCPV